MKLVKYFLFLALFIISSMANAWDNQVVGKVARIEVHDPNSSARNVTVRLQGVSTMCSLTSNNQTGYIQKADAPDTFNVFISTLLSAKATGSDVQLYIDIGSSGCQIHRVDLL